MLTYRLLRLLVESWPNIVTRNEVIEQVWGPNRIVTPENLSQRLLTLRRALGDDANQPRYVESVRGHGYRLIPEVETISCEQRSTDAARIGQAGLLPNSIAVLPLKTISPNPADDFFTAGLHEEIISQLARLAEVNVIARTSVQRYDTTIIPLAEIARELNVSRIMEGSVRHDGNQVRIAIQTIDPATGAQVLARTYQRDRCDVFDVQREVAEDIAGATLAEFSLEDPERTAGDSQISPAVHALYLHALASMPDYAQSMMHLDRAIDLEPSYASANGLKAMIFALATVNSFHRAALGASGIDREECRSLAATHAERALSVDDATGTALLANALLDLFSWRWDAAEAACGRAVEAMPNDPRVLSLSAWIRAFCGNPDDAMRLANRALDLDPNSAETNFWCGIVARYARRPELAVAAHRRAVRLAPANVLFNINLAASLAQLGDETEAERRYRTAEQLVGKAGGLILAFLSYGYERLGLVDDARRIVARLDWRNADYPAGAGGWAMAYLAVGDTVRALEELRSAITKAESRQLDSGFFSLMAIRFNVYDDERLDEPEFRELRKGLGPV